ncbi:MAG: hypothetical protein ABJG78_12085 [Cyclobacteriaceae bacterium]
MSFSAKNEPFTIKKELYNELQKVGLKTLSDFITDKPQNELSELISQAITLYSYSISTFDIHLRISHLITIYESLLLEYDRKYKMEASVKKRIKKLIPTNRPQHSAYLEVLFGEMYQVRHKMVHKARRLHLNMDYVREFQLTTIEMIKALCHLSNSLASKEQLIEYLDN